MKRPIKENKYFLPVLLVVLAAVISASAAFTIAKYIKTVDVETLTLLLPQKPGAPLKLDLVYYEKYTDENNDVTYGIDFGEDCGNEKQTAAEKNPLLDVGSTEKIIREDGYAVAVISEEFNKGEFEAARVTYTDRGHHVYNLTISETDKLGTWKNSSGGVVEDNVEPIELDSGYVLYPLPIDLYDETTMDQRFYQSLNIVANYNPGEGTTYFYFNPHFGITVIAADDTAAAPANPGNDPVSVRTPRHFYGLSFCSVNQGQIATIIDNCYFMQEFDLDYAEYTGRFTKIKEMSVSDSAGMHSIQLEVDGKRVDPYPQYGIRFYSKSQGNTDGSSNCVYDGCCRLLKGVYPAECAQYGEKNYESDSVGLFGYVANGCTVKNIVHEMYPDKAVTFTVGGDTGVGELVGTNFGTVENCALYGANLHIVGGIGTRNCGVMIGHNEEGGVVRNCYAELANVTASQVFVGGLAAVNYGEISYCYTVGRMALVAGDTGTADNHFTLAGLVSVNEATGLIQNCYTAVYAENSQYRYGIAGVPDKGAYGTITNSCWLSGTFKYRDIMYTINAGAYKDKELSISSNDELAGRVAGTEFGTAEHTYLRTVTDEYEYSANYEGREFPYLATVKDSNGELVHYGLWPIDGEAFNTPTDCIKLVFEYDGVELSNITDGIVIDWNAANLITGVTTSGTGGYVIEGNNVVCSMPHYAGIGGSTVKLTMYDGSGELDVKLLSVDGIDGLDVASWEWVVDDITSIEFEIPSEVRSGEIRFKVTYAD